MPPFFFASRIRPWRTLPSAPMFLQNSVMTCARNGEPGSRQRLLCAPAAARVGPGRGGGRSERVCARRGPVRRGTALGCPDWFHRSRRPPRRARALPARAAAPAGAARRSPSGTRNPGSLWRPGCSGLARERGRPQTASVPRACECSEMALPRNWLNCLTPMTLRATTTIGAKTPPSLSLPARTRSTPRAAGRTAAAALRRTGAPPRRQAAELRAGGGVHRLAIEAAGRAQRWPKSATSRGHEKRAPPHKR